jgi:hypothetical protein
MPLRESAISPALRAWREGSAMNFTFRAPTLFESTAVPGDMEQYHDALDACRTLAKIKKFALWLQAEINKKGLAIKAPLLDESGWAFELPSEDGGCALCIIGNLNGDETLITMVIADIGGAQAEYDRFAEAAEAVLSRSGEITELKIDP